MFLTFAGFSLRADYGKAGTTARTEAREILGNPCLIGAVPVLKARRGAHSPRLNRGSIVRAAQRPISKLPFEI